MQFLPLRLGILVAIIAMQPTSAQPRSEAVLVRYAVDGDTIDVAGIGRVRLIGIDAPELGRGFDTAAPFATEAHQRLSGLIARRWVRLEYEERGERRDSYDRRLAYVLLEDGLFVNAVLVREGLARVSARRALRRLHELRRAEAEARAFRRGMWGARPSLPIERYRVPRARPRRSGKPARDLIGRSSP